MEKNARGKLVDICSILKIESTSKFVRQIDVMISTWIRLSKSIKSRQHFRVEFRRRIDSELTKMCPLGLDLLSTCCVRSFQNKDLLENFSFLNNY